MRIKKKNVFLSLIVSLLYSVAYTIIGPATLAQDYNIDKSYIVKFAICFVICAVAGFCFFTFAPLVDLHKADGILGRGLKKIGDPGLLIIVWLLIFLSWIPAFLLVYPGVLSYDMISQTNSALTEITSNHHPILHTWLIREFMFLGKDLFSSYEKGLGFLSLFQMVVLSFSLAFMIIYLKKKKVPLLVVIVTAVFSAAWFMNAILSVTMIKDTLFAAFLVLFVCFFTEIATDPTEYISNKANYFIFPVIGFLMCALRNNGIHIYVFCFAGLMILRISRIKKIKAYIPLIISVIVPVIMFKVYTGPIFSALDIKQSAAAEALCVPIQQIQRLTVTKSNALSVEQMEQIDYYIDNLEWRDYGNERQYNPFFADPAKSCFYSNRYKEDPIAFWKFYIKTGIQFSKEYIVAFMSNSLGYWYPGYYEYTYVMYDNYSPDVFMEPLNRMSIWDSETMNSFYDGLCSSDFWRETPGLRMFFVPGFAPWILLYALIASWRKRGFISGGLAVFLPLIAQYGIMLLSPMSSFRYSWPFYLILPIVFVPLFDKAEVSDL